MQCQDVAWKEKDQGICLSQTQVCSKVVATRAYLSLPCLGRSQHLNTPHEWGLGFLIPVFLQAAKGACVIYVEPQEWDVKSVAWPTHSPGLVSDYVISLCLLVPSPGARGLDPMLYFSFYLVTCAFFLQPYLYSTPSAHFQLVFHENFSIYIYIYFFLMCSWKEGNSSSSLCHLELPLSLFEPVMLGNVKSMMQLLLGGGTSKFKLTILKN